MIGLDTNVLVRYFQQDDSAQSARANALMSSLSSERPGFVSLIALVELVWVLVRNYEVDRPTIATLLENMLRSRELVIEQAANVRSALQQFRQSKAGFADCLIEQLGAAAGCDYTATFDQNAAKTAKMRLLR
ncbi:PIN domain-containing protein [Silvibacterium acidisoli]|uniref:PIN domain-containing protein n=1 Tax=Acidobacteriaceae bacterium ZG23-2 TaxID=2883246 RepID=UPI00406D0EEB